MAILIVCSDDERLSRLKDAVHSAGFRLISARGLDEAWTKSDFFDFEAVVIDHELKYHSAAAAFRERFITLSLEQDVPPEVLAMDLSNLLRKGSELVQ